MKKLDVIGVKFGRLTVLSEASPRMSSGRPLRFMNVVCDCGNQKEVALRLLRAGYSASCGCFRKEKTGCMSRRHGDTGSRLHRIWKGMKSRCYIPSASNFEYYGGLGIKVCDEWHEYLPFKAWALSNGYDETLTIDRKNGNGHYEPSNCRWVTCSEQAFNRIPRR